MSLASGESVRFRASRASRSSADSEQQRHRASEEAYVGRLSQEHPEPDPFLEAFEYFKEQQRRLDVESSITPEQVEEETRFGCLLSAEEIDQLVEEDAIRRRIQSTILMDIFFGLVIVANGAMMGLTTQGVVDESSDEAQIFEPVCMAIFTVEFLLHWLAERCSGSHGCCGSLCRIMKDGWIQFDVLCVIMSWLDFFLTFVFNIGAGTSTFAVLRVVRLMRLLRLVRLLRILQQLWLLLSSMIASMRVLFWAIAMLAAICYIFGILVFTLSQNGSDPLMAAQWGGVLESMFSLAEIATYNGMEIIRKRTEGSDVLLFLPVLFIFMAITSMGIMNLIIGVLLTAVLERGNQELCAVIQFLRMPTFLILVFIGIFATIPWSVFGQKIFFFQLCGLKDWQVSILPAANKATAMLGTILGGRMGDCFARLGRFGRPLCAQLALAIAIPVMFLQFYGLPPGEGLFWVYLVLIVIFSIFGFWPQCAANLPILSGIVPAEDSCKVMAWQSAFENCLAHAVGPPMISVLSSAFGYSFGDNPEHSHELNLERARALGKAMAATMCIPWMIAMVAYTCLYWSYPRDMGKLYASLSALLG